MLHMLTSRTNATVSSAYFPLPPIELPQSANNNSWGTNLPTMQTNFWLRDVTNIYTCSVAALGSLYWAITNANLATYTCTAISPRHAITAGHVGGFFTNGQKMVWFEPDGTYFTNTVVDQISEYYIVDDFDVILFAEDFPRFAKLMPWISGSGNDLAFVCRHRVGTTFTVASQYPSSLVTVGINYGDYFNPPESTNYVFGWHGDSSNPMWAIINNEAVFVGPASTPLSTTPLAKSITAINKDMELLSTNHNAPIYSATLYNILR